VRVPEVGDGEAKGETMKTKIFVETEFGTAEFVGVSPEAADKVLKSKLRKIHLSIKKLNFHRETGWGDELHVLYGYMPTRPGYDREKAQVLTERTGQ